jgi:transposase
MLTLGPNLRVFVAVEPVDLRRGHDGLVTLVRAAGAHDPYAGHLFVFLGRRADRVKVLFWDRGGFVLYYKRLERGRFRLPVVPAGATDVELDATALAMLLDGIDVKRVARPAPWSPTSHASTPQARHRAT